MQKYYYQKGRCPESLYMSLNPVLYEENGNKKEYKKVRMVCGGWKDGLPAKVGCSLAETCPLLEAAPELVIDDGINLRDKKLGE